MARARRGLRAVAPATVARPVSVAIYTRKSTDKGLDREFTSIDNQRQTCERYVSQMEGARPLATRYDDGGFSGGTTDRPALQRLIADIKAGQVDCVVAYKYDRLGRSMIDCLRMFELFDRHDVRFVSVTQQIDTSTSHGRMFVNNLLSFAQYERDVISERTRDKMQAARRRGQWTGGMPPLGYDVAPEGGRIEVNRAEAQQVRATFELYAERPSLIEIAAELNRRGWRRKSWTTKTGKRRQGGRWDRVSLSRLLRDPIYIGKQKLGDEVFEGEHERIVPQRLFDRVQRLLDTNRTTGGSTARNRYGALLRGLLHCSACDRAMTHTPAKRNGRVHRYYRCQGAQKNGAQACPTKSIRAEAIERFVVDQIRRIGASSELQDETFRQALAQVKVQARGLRVEAKRIKNELARAEDNTQRLTQTLSRVQGPTCDAIAEELGNTHEQVVTLRARQGEIKDQLAALKTQDVNREHLARALEAFDPIWDVLLVPEKERILRLLIERIDYSGADGRLEIRWRLAGFGQLAEELDGGSTP